MSDPIYIVFGRTIDIYDDLDEAKRSAWYQNESDEGWFDKLEIVHVGGETTVLTEGDIPEFRQWNNEAMDQWRTSRTEKPHVANLVIDGHVSDSFYNPDGTNRARDEYERLRPFLGDRIKLESVPHPISR